MAKQPTALSAPERKTAAAYRYAARDERGRTRRGTMTALDEADLYDRLLAQGLYLRSSAKKRTRGGKKRLKTKSLAEFCRQLSNLLGAGVSLAPALEMIAKDESMDAAQRRIYADVLSQVRRGVDFSAALESEGVFPRLMLGMIRAGEGTGDLARVAGRLALQFEKQYQMEQRLRSAMVYPAVLGVLAVAVVIIIVTFVLPQFEDLFSTMTELPAATRALIAFSNFLTAKWYAVALVIAALVVAVRTVLRMPAVRLRHDRTKLRLPLLGRLFRTICTARFARALGSLYASGMPIVNALSVARESVGNAYISGQFDAVLASVRSGAELSAALSQVDGLQNKLIAAIRVGEQTGRLDTMLDSAAEIMEYDAQQASARMVTILEPMLIVIMALVVGFIMVAVMGPIIGSYSAIEGSANL